MSNILTIPDECESMIRDFLGTCQHNSKLYLVNKKYHSMFTICKPNSYDNILGCQLHTPDHYGAIITLTEVRSKYIRGKGKGKSKGKYKYKPISIHFQSRKQREIGEIYALEFGEKSHYCCRGKGIMFKEN